MPDIGTTSRQLLAKTKAIDYVVRADSANTDAIYISETDNTFTDNYDVLLAGDELSFENFAGSLFIVAKSGTQKYHIPFANNMAIRQ